MYRAYESQYNTWHKEGALQILGSKTTRGQHFSFQVMFRHDLLHIPVTALPPLYTWHHQRTKGPLQRLEKTAPPFPVWVAITHSFPYFPRLWRTPLGVPFSKLLPSCLAVLDKIPGSGNYMGIKGVRQDEHTFSLNPSRTLSTSSHFRMHRNGYPPAPKQGWPPTPRCGHKAGLPVRPNIKHL